MKLELDVASHFAQVLLVVTLEIFQMLSMYAPWNYLNILVMKVDHIYSRHFFEHLTFEEGRKTLNKLENTKT